MNLFLIRHGESVGNAAGRLQGQSDSPLNDRGREQARALAARLNRQGWAPAAIYASDLKRASETAEILAAPLRMPIQLDTRLREYDAGVLNGIIWAEVEFLYPEIWKAYHSSAGWADIPGEEGDIAFNSRLSNFLAEVRERHVGGETVAVVTHGGCLAVLVAHLVGLPAGKRQPFRFKNASLTWVEIGARGPILVRSNDTSHLDGDPDLRAWEPGAKEGAEVNSSESSGPRSEQKGAAKYGAPEAW
jgi:broad specificity phosphatase PhoE